MSEKIPGAVKSIFFHSIEHRLELAKKIHDRRVEKAENEKREHERKENMGIVNFLLLFIFLMIVISTLVFGYVRHKMESGKS